MNIAELLGIDAAYVPFVIAGAIVVVGFAGDGIRALVRLARRRNVEVR